MNPSDLRKRHDSLAEKVRLAGSMSAKLLDQCLSFAGEAARAGRADLVVSLLSPLQEAAAGSALYWYLLGLGWREEQQLDQAVHALQQAERLAPENATILALSGQCLLENGRPAARLLAKAMQHAPNDLAIARACAVALAAEGDAKAAEALLSQKLAAHPDWIEGHKTLANLWASMGAADKISASFAEACAAQPENLHLRMAWFHTIAQMRNWEVARQIIDEGEKLFGPQRALAVARLYVASESGAAGKDPQLFESLAGMKDAGVDLAHVRHALRCGEAKKAETLCLTHLGTAAAAMFWPYLSVAWRLLGDARAAWLDGAEQFITHYDLDFSAAELQALAQVLRQLHDKQQPFLDQSVRGGTQTDRPLFFHHHPAVQQARAKITAAVRQYIDALPAHDDRHPLLAHPRNQIYFSGSWSVRLKAAGYHVNHSHPLGWISSAFYVSLPEPSQMGAKPAGWLSFGQPPVELGLTLPAYRLIEPKPGRLVLFPSTMWHGTVPFADGERLTLAFDVRVPNVRD